MMGHEEVSRLVVDRFMERLDPAAREHVDDHLAACGECRDALAMLGVLAGDRAGGGLTRGPSSHPSSEAIAALAGDTAPLHGARDDSARAHVASCPTCAAEVEACRGAIAAARAGARAAVPRARPFIPAALAATLLVALLGYPAYRGLVDLPQALRRSEASAASEERARAEASAARAALERDRVAATPPVEGGVVQALYLDATRGGAERAPVVTLQPGAGVVTILLEAAAVRTAEEEDGIRFEISDRSGRVAWSAETTAGSIRAGGGSADRIFSLVVPARALPPGAYTLVIKKAGDAGAASLLTAPFATVAPAPASPRR